MLRHLPSTIPEVYITARVRIQVKNAVASGEWRAGRRRRRDLGAYPVCGGRSREVSAKGGVPSRRPELGVRASRPFGRHPPEAGLGVLDEVLKFFGDGNDSVRRA